MQRAQVLATGERRVGLDGLGTRLVQAREDERVDLRVALGDARRMSVEELDGAHLARWIACAIHVADALTSCSDMVRR